MEGSHNCVMVIKEMTLLVGLTFSWNEIGDYVGNVSARTEKSKPLRREDPNSPHNRTNFSLWPEEPLVQNISRTRRFHVFRC